MVDEQIVDETYRIVQNNYTGSEFGKLEWDAVKRKMIREYGPENMPNSHEAVKFMKPIPPLLIGLLLCSCGGHTNKSVPESVKTSAKVVAVSPVLLVPAAQ